MSTVVYNVATTIRGIEQKKVPVYPLEGGNVTYDTVYRTSLENGTILILDSILHIGQTVTLTVVAEDMV